ncbi:ATP-binding protein [Caryophanon latum]|uniref:histidine kinase n=1 Tax=Caryophanon latum TaxID=33977 RepID=A0A1C0YYY0_9BACL|nr:ATP-binding protein [Caryophanon latum]OCS92303.1 hypothetical protein A6K76_07405 [Caryophanon latum]
MPSVKVTSTTPDTFLWMLFIAVTTAILSQVYVMPFQDGHLRFGLGPVVFLLLLLVQRRAYIQTSLLTAAFVLSSRIFLSLLTVDTTLYEALLNHIPSSVYYIGYGVMLHFIHVEQLQHRPLRLSIFATCIDLFSNVIEHVLSMILLQVSLIDSQQFLIMLVVAFVRSFTTMGIYSTTVINTQQKQIESMLKMDSNLYVESLYIQKAMNEIEQITSNSYQLYRELQQANLRAHSMQALLLAQQIHEVKKDTERIFAGISKLLLHKEHQEYTLNDVLHLVTTANSQYAALLNKTITIQATSDENFTMLRITPLLAIINNLMSNAIEAIAQQGTIILHVHSEHEYTYFTVTDDGSGMSAETIGIIFEPGYTTKFNAEGVAATGIGLSHVQQILERLEGTIDVQSTPGHTQFVVKVKTIYIKKEG